MGLGKLVSCSCCFGLLCVVSISADQRPPNIIVILADDLGTGDVRSQSPTSKIPTPYLDRLAAQGMRFTDAHSASAVCSPTRYGLLTGRYAWRTRLQEWVLACYEPPLIDVARLTLPAFLREQGYHTAAIGKWHLGWQWPGPQPSRMLEDRNALRRAEWDYTKPVRGGPTERGFDLYFGTDVPNHPPFTFIENDRVSPLPTARFSHRDGDQYLLGRMFDGAPMAPGWRFDRILPTLTERAVAYIRDRAAREEPFFLYFAMTSPHTPIAPSQEFAGRSGTAPIADFIIETDWSAGQLIKEVDQAGIASDTIIIFTSDNGHSRHSGALRLVAAGHRPSGLYRGYKGEIWEGGHRVPFIVRWPDRVAPGSTSNRLLCLNDVLATCAELLGRKLPDDAAEDSFSFLPALLGIKHERPRASLVCHSAQGEFAYREGPWKLVFKSPSANVAQARGKPAVVELYNLETDIAETTNLAREHPDIVQNFTAKLQRIVDRGRSRPGPPQRNDTDVRFDVMQSARWARASRS